MCAILKLNAAPLSIIENRWTSCARDIAARPAAAGGAATACQAAAMLHISVERRWLCALHLWLQHQVQ